MLGKTDFDFLEWGDHAAIERFMKQKDYKNPKNGSYYHYRTIRAYCTGFTKNRNEVIEKAILEFLEERQRTNKRMSNVLNA